MYLELHSDDIPFSTSSSCITNVKSIIGDLVMFNIVEVWITSTIPDLTAKGESSALTADNKYLICSSGITGLNITTDNISLPWP